ncbi:MAG: hypothetical protein QF565_12735 [Arenicellales bacterium]|jgi:hypothetical protein|nr:hypothetical protein [Arenicellales bacterium]|tara:strand:- start:79 stop:696 length:618 start_codon:yes stop_codon:yes gene_type:complete
MAIIANIVAKPILSKTDLAVSRVRQMATIREKHGFQARVVQYASGPNADCIGLQAMAKDFTSFGKGYASFIKDPDYQELMSQRQSDPAVEIVSRNIYRTVYGESNWSDYPVSLQRSYHLPVHNLSKALDILAKVDNLTGDDTNLIAAVPVTGPEMSAMTAVYQFRSFESSGKALDEVGLSSEFRALAEEASELGELRTAQILSAI